MVLVIVVFKLDKITELQVDGSLWVDDEHTGGEVDAPEFVGFLLCREDEIVFNWASDLEGGLGVEVVKEIVSDLEDVALSGIEFFAVNDIHGRLALHYWLAPGL